MQQFELKEKGVFLLTFYQSTLCGENERTWWHCYLSGSHCLCSFSLLPDLWQNSYRQPAWTPGPVNTGKCTQSLLLPTVRTPVPYRMVYVSKRHKVLFNDCAHCHFEKNFRNYPNFPQQITNNVESRDPCRWGEWRVSTTSGQH